MFDYLRLIVFRFAVAALLLSSCGPYRLVSAYDTVIDQGISDFHTGVTTFVGKMAVVAGTPEGTYESNKSIYPEFNGQLATLYMRAAQTSLNSITTEALKEVIGNVERLRLLHQSGGDKGLPDVLGKPALAAIDVQCESIIKLEIAKKRGEEAE